MKLGLTKFLRSRKAVNNLPSSWTPACPAPTHAKLLKIQEKKDYKEGKKDKGRNKGGDKSENKDQNESEIISENDIPHISCYALTVEPGTLLNKKRKEDRRKYNKSRKQRNSSYQCWRWRWGRRKRR